MKKLQTKRAVIYCRVSSKEQVEEGNSLATQQRICKEYCEKNEIEVVKVFIEEGESAKTVNRAQLNALLTFCALKKNGINAIIVYKIDRLSRNTDDYSQLRIMLKRYGVEIKSTSENFEDNPVGRFMENTMANIAQFDNDIRTERSVGGMKEAMREGRYVWKVPIGYCRVRVAGRYTIAPDSRLAPLLKKAFQMIAYGNFPIEHVRIKMHEQGLTQSQGKPIVRSFFYQLLKNPVYAGLIVKFGEVHKGLFESIISEQLFKDTQLGLMRKAKAVVPYKSDHPDFPLRKFVRSEENDMKLTGSWSKGNTKKYAYYRFISKGKNYKKIDLESDFIAFMNRYGFRGEALEAFEKFVHIHFIEGTTKRRNDKRLIEKQLTELTNNESLLVAKNIKGVINDDILKSQLEQLQAEKFTLNKKLSELMLDTVDYRLLLEKIRHYIQLPGSFWNELDISGKIALQEFQFPGGIILSKNGFRTQNLCCLFKVNCILSPSMSSIVRSNDKTSNPPIIPNGDLLDNLQCNLNKLASLVDNYNEINSNKKPAT